MKDPHRYDDMLHMPHHESDHHPRMSSYNRAAQFSPFAALTGYEDAIQEEARYTDVKTELDENQKTKLDRKIQLLINHLPEKPEITLKYFLPDTLKSGGSYEKVTGVIKKINSTEQLITFYAEDGFHDGLQISIDQIVEVEGDLFNGMEYQLI